MIYTFAQLPPRDLSSQDFPDNTIALNITRSVNGQPSDALLSQADIMAFTQRAWRLSPKHANDAKLILATYVVPGRGRLILGAFRFGRQYEHPGGDCFVRSPYPKDEDRCIFLAEPAEAEIWRKYVGHYLPLTKKGEANPVRYYDTDEEN
ncbi:MAG: hypothetical protein K2K82_01820 [Muribaculaceae bacterium]|nr:hypothetical protein [Muribaculaceae bacterium]